ncbi:cytosolic phospholipase A2 gamma-like isoform X2 [Lissotriton helveticus]
MHWLTSGFLLFFAFLWLQSDQLFGAPPENAPEETLPSGDNIPLVHVSSDLSEGEKISIRERRKVVSAFFERHGIKVAPEDVPVIACMGSGGGLTATISFMTMLEEMKHQDLLDACMYTYGCSGSSWALSNLYDSGDWVNNLEKVNAEFFNRISGLSLDLSQALEELLEAADDENFSLTHVWEVTFVNIALKKYNKHNMSSWKPFLQNGSVPYGICSAVDKDIIEKTNFTNPDINVEFTSHWSGYNEKGIYVETTHFESVFENKELVRKLREPHLSYLQALWGSAIASIPELFEFFLDIVLKMLKDPVGNVLVPGLETVLLPRVLPLGTDTLLNLALLTDLSGILKRVTGSIGGGDSKQPLLDLVSSLAENKDTTSYQMANKMIDYWDAIGDQAKHNAATVLSMTMAAELVSLPVPLPLPKVVKLLLKIIKCLVTFEWGTTNNFANKMTIKEPSKIHLMDSGVSMATPFPLALRSPRKTKLILNFDYMPLDPLASSVRAAAYCSANNISFPPIVIPPGDEFNPSQACYVFEGVDTPTVIHVSLFNKQNSGGGIKALTVQYLVLRTQYLKGEIDALRGYARANIKICAPKIREKILKLVKEQ